jgi:hypothetical protein
MEGNSMKGTIVKCVEELVVSRFGDATWRDILKGAGLQPNKFYIAIQDVDDAEAMQIIKSACSTLKLSLQQVADAFGEHWMTSYAPKVYQSVLEKSKNARDFLLSIDAVHTLLTKTMANARPPHFEYDTTDPKRLVMSYHSHRDLLPMVAGLARGVGKYYKENLRVTIVPPNKVEVVFE